MSGWRYTCDGKVIGDLDSPLWRCPDGRTALEVSGPNSVSGLDFDENDRTLARYHELLPVHRDDLITLGAGMTPLVQANLAGRDVWIKLDSLLPTGSFKDRGAAVVVSHLASIGVEKMVHDSSGNAAAAMAAYSAAAGINCVIYAPASASPDKLVQARAYGADVRLVEGSRDDVAAAGQDAAERVPDAFYASHNWSPLFAEGVKTVALEIWEQLGRVAPACVFIPTGGGSVLAGAFRGFEATGAMPRLVAAQPAACAPVVRAIAAGEDRIRPASPGTTLAEGAKIGNPPRGPILLAAVRRSNGWADEVEEHELVEALRALWSQGIYPEPTGALSAAAFMKAVRQGREIPDGPVVILVTGSGLKATEQIAGLVERRIA